MLRRAIVFLATLAAMAALVTAAGSQVNLASLGVPVSLADRLRAGAHDVKSLAPVLAAVLAPAALLMFLLAGAAIRFSLFRRVFVYAVAGAGSVLLVLAALGAFFDVPVLASARSMDGIALQTAAGGLAGLVYALFGPRSRLSG